MVKSLTLAFKDIKLLLRDPGALFWVAIFPLFMAVIFGSVFGGSNGANKISVTLIDQDQTKISGQLITELEGSKALDVTSLERAPGQSSLDAAKEAVRKGDLAAYVLVPKGFGKEVEQFSYEAGPPIKIGIDPSRQAEAGMLTGVTSEAAFKLMGTMMSGGTGATWADRVSQIKNSKLQPAQKKALVQLVSDAGQWQRASVSSNTDRNNGFQFQGPKIESDSMADSSAKPRSPYEITFPQAMLWGLLGVISSFAIGLVKEREQGTLVRLQTSMSMGQVLAGKAFACLLTSLVVMGGLLALGHIVFHIRIESPLLLGVAILAGAICVVGIMMLLSVLGRTEQAVSGSSWGIMILMSMFGGGMIPVFMMPPWMQEASNFSPLKWTVLSVEGAIWRGFSWQEMMRPCLVLVAIGAVTFLAGVRVLKARE